MSSTRRPGGCSIDVETHEEIANPLYLAEASAAIVHDTSFFGATGPIYGSRVSRSSSGRRPARCSTRACSPTGGGTSCRCGRSPSRSAACTTAATAATAEHPQLVDLYAAIRSSCTATASGRSRAAECLREDTGADCAVFNSLIGSRMLVANAEVRAPLVGLFTGEIEYGRDPGRSRGVLRCRRRLDRRQPPDVRRRDARRWCAAPAPPSASTSFGMLILEIAASRPFDRIDRSWQWQIGTPTEILRHGHKRSQYCTNAGNTALTLEVRR